MWDIYVKHYLKRNRAASLSILATVFISVIFLSFFTTLFYNLWMDERARALYEGRIWKPTTLTILYAAILLLICTALLVMIYYAFEMTKDGRMHQIGMLQSVGATPEQIFIVLMEEALVLGFLPLVPGMLPGIALTYFFTVKANEVNRIAGNMEVTFIYNPKLFFLTALLCCSTVWLAAARAALRLSKTGTLEAMRGEMGELSEKWGRKRLRFKTKHRSLEWEIARRSIYARRKSFRTASLSLTLSYLAFSLFLNLWVISGISRQITYFERYWDTWDAQRRIAEMTYEQLIERAYNMTMGGVCVLLAGIGIANLFANMLGSIRMRRREFARYQSMGFTQESLWRMLILETAFVALRPICISLPVNVLFVMWAIHISPPTMQDYLKAMPVFPLALFAAAILVFAGAACLISGKRILEADMVESLKDDTLY